MSENYFTKFGLVSYNDTLVTDISKRVVFDETVSKLPTIFYPYEISSGMRSDVVANYYYNDPYLDWMIYLSNGIIDPQYGWYLSVDDFNKFIKKKYGSIENAQSKIKNFALDAFNTESNITASYYENNIPAVLKKYYNPVFGAGARIIAYTKRPDTWTVNTNRIVQYFVNTAGFVVGERIKLRDAGENIIGVAEITKINSDSLIVQHELKIAGTIVDVLGEDSNTLSAVSNISILVINIPDDEFVYWTPTYFYDYEYDKNEQNKFVRLLDSRFSLEASEAVRKKLQ